MLQQLFCPVQNSLVAPWISKLLTCTGASPLFVTWKLVEVCSRLARWRPKSYELGLKLSCGATDSPETGKYSGARPPWKVIASVACLRPSEVGLRPNWKTHFWPSGSAPPQLPPLVKNSFGSAP